MRASLLTNNALVDFYMKTTDQLNEQQLTELETLRQACKAENGSTPNLYTHILSQPRIYPASALYYENNQLQGFISAFFFYDRAVEISLLVHPTARRRGIATALLNEILPLLKSLQIHNLIFSNPEKLNNHWLPQHGFSFTHSEYYMCREILSPLLGHNNTLVFQPATENEIPLLYSLDEACFANKINQDNYRFHNLIDNREYSVIIAFLGNKPIGKAHIRWGSEGATLSDIAIEPAHQGKGLGTSLIAHCVNFALSEGKSTISLDVETHNKKALDLYTRLGFIIQNACDYWSIGMEQLILDKV